MCICVYIRVYTRTVCKHTHTHTEEWVVEANISEHMKSEVTKYILTFPKCRSKESHESLRFYI